MPDLVDPAYVSAARIAERNLQPAGHRIKWPFGTQIRETRVHLGADCACPGPQRGIRWPCGASRAFIEVLADRQGLPDPELPVQQHRHTAGRRIRPDRGCKTRGIEIEYEFVEFEIQMSEQDPRSQGPG